MPPADPPLRKHTRSGAPPIALARTVLALVLVAGLGDAEAKKGKKGDKKKTDSELVKDAVKARKSEIEACTAPYLQDGGDKVLIKASLIYSPPDRRPSEVSVYVASYGPTSPGSDSIKACVESVLFDIDVPSLSEFYTADFMWDCGSRTPDPPSCS